MSTTATHRDGTGTDHFVPSVNHRRANRDGEPRRDGFLYPVPVVPVAGGTVTHINEVNMDHQQVPAEDSLDENYGPTLKVPVELDTLRWALEVFAATKQQLPTMWPARPDAERIRFYEWAERQLEECAIAIDAASTLLAHANVFLSGVLSDIDEFHETGAVPEVDDDATGDGSGDPLLRLLMANAALVRGESSRIATMEVPGDGAPDAAPARPASTRTRTSRAEREEQIRRLHGAGLTQREIAAKLHSSLSTVNRVVNGRREKGR